MKLDINQELTLERQAFEAHMRINNGLTQIALENVSVVVNFTDKDGQPVLASSDPNSPTAKFFLRVDDLQNIPAVDGTGMVQPSSSADIRWLIIPAPGASDGTPQGELYYVGATLSYTLGGEHQVTEVTPDYMYVKPLPELVLDYFLPGDVYGDDAFTSEVEPPVPFSLGVRVSNQGFGTTKQLTIDSAQPKIVENTQGLLIDFLLTGSEVNGQSATESLLVDFGNLAPDTAGVARWTMTCSLSGQFKTFTAEFSHADELGGQLTSLINAVNTHTLVRDVLVDLPGRDAIRDFLATDDPSATTVAYTVYESEHTQSAVTDPSAVATLTPVDGSGTTYTLAAPATAGFLYVRKAVPDTLAVPDDWPWPVSAVRSDGKAINPANVWISKTRKTNPEDGWDYWVNLFDANTTETYTLTFEGAHPPVLQVLPNQSGVEGQLLTFDIQATDPDGTLPLLSAVPLPMGAGFTDHHDGTGTFTWTPSAGQAGTYLITLTASDGALTDAQQVTLTITPASGYMITASAGPGGTIPPPGVIIVTSGAEQSFTITLQAGYHLADVLVDGASVGAVNVYTLANVTANHTLAAVFAIDFPSDRYKTFAFRRIIC